jgi:hypothetical protein
MKIRDISYAAIFALLMFAFGCEEKGDPDSAKSNKSIPSTSAPASEESCKKLTAKACLDSHECHYDGTKRSCGKAVNAGCGAIQEGKACTDSSLGCSWDGKNCAKKGDAVTVYRWSKIIEPAGYTPDFHTVVASGDNGLYALNTAPKAMGLWYLKEGDSAWIVPTLTGKPNNHATTAETELNITAAEISSGSVKISATADGVVVRKGKQLFVLKGGDVSWALETSKHHENATGTDKVPHIIQDLDITFSDVIDTPSGKGILFQQAKTYLTTGLYALVFHDLTNNDVSGFVKFNIQSPNKSVINLDVKVVANDGANGLLVGGENPNWITVSNKWHIYHIPSANITPGDNFGVIAHERPVLVSTSEGIGRKKGWPDSAEPMKVIGKKDEYYFVSVDAPNNFLGLAFYKGPQPSRGSSLTGTEADLTRSFEGFGIVGRKEFNGRTLFATSSGFLGANAELQHDASLDFKFEDFQAKNEMDANNAPPPVLKNEDLTAILGDSNKLYYFVVKGPAAGIYKRVKEIGQPRL